MLTTTSNAQDRNQRLKILNLNQLPLVTRDEYYEITKDKNTEKSIHTWSLFRFVGSSNSKSSSWDSDFTSPCWNSSNRNLLRVSLAIGTAAYNASVRTVNVTNLDFEKMPLV